MKTVRQAGTEAMTLPLIEDAKNARKGNGKTRKARSRAWCATRLNGAPEATSAKRDTKVLAAASA